MHALLSWFLLEMFVSLCLTDVYVHVCVCACVCLCTFSSVSPVGVCKERHSKKIMISCGNSPWWCNADETTCFRKSLEKICWKDW